MTETVDAFFDGRAKLYQPATGFRAGTDTVLLAASVPAKQGEFILEIAAGSGVGLVLLGLRVPDLALRGVELLLPNARRANRNLKANNLDGAVIAGNIFTSKHNLLKRQFDHVFVNPPFFAESSHTSPQDQEKSKAHIHPRSLTEWTSASLKRVRPNGTLSMIFPPQNLPEVLSALPAGAAIVLQPITTVEGRPAKRIILQVRNQRKGGLVLNDPIKLKYDWGEITEQATDITRGGQGIDMGLLKN